MSTLVSVIQSPSVDKSYAHGEERYERCGFLLGRIGKLASRRFAKALENTGMKPPQAGVLLTLRDRGAMTQQALGDLLHVDPSNLVGILNELEDNGLAVRRRDPDDRRRHIVEISPVGLEQVAGIEEVVAEVEDGLLAGLDEGERAQLQRLLGRVVERAAAEEGPAGEIADLAAAQAPTGAGSP
jgi:DNA-binding MarR family transcriptional regulator